MANFILIIHVILAVVIIGLIMIQQGKGAEMGASFGSGSSQTVFGAAGSANLFSRLTAVFTTLFFVSSFALAIFAKNASEISTDDFGPEIESVTGGAAQAESGLEAIESEAGEQAPIMIEDPASALEGE